MFKKIAALALSGIIMTGMTTAFAEASEPVHSASVVMEYDAAAIAWSGKTTLKAGKSYVVTKDVTINKEVTVPKGTSLTIKNGAKLTVGFKGSLKINGTVTVGKGSTLAVSGALTQAKGKKLVVSGTVKLGKKSTVDINGSVTVKKGGVISGEPKAANVGDSAKFTVSGKLTSQKLLNAYDTVQITDLVNRLYEKAFVEGKVSEMFKECYPEAVYKAAVAEYEETLAGSGYEMEYSFDEYMDALGEFLIAVYAEAFNGQPITGVKVTDLVINPISLEYLPESEYASCYGKIERAAEVNGVAVICAGEQTSEEITMDGTMVYCGGRWYLYMDT